jgi:hypothetical protein
MGYMSRKPNSNDPPSPERAGRWLDTSDVMDEFALMISGNAKRCRGCKRATSLKYLVDGQCPDCRQGPTINPDHMREKRASYGASSDGVGDAE